MDNPEKHIGILWGGGLGDLLIIRPFLEAIHSSATADSSLFTTASHLSGIFEEMCSPTKVILLPRKPSALFPVLKQWAGFFDIVYIGPYPTIKTRILARMFFPGRVWSCRYSDVPEFILEQVLSDIEEMGFKKRIDRGNLASFLPWQVRSGFNPFKPPRPFFVLHPSAKARWNTTLWPVEKWAQLMLEIMNETSQSICLIGTSNEKEHLAEIVRMLPHGYTKRLKTCLSMPLREVASLVFSSDGVICHNSGILHLSTFLGKKTICITGSSAEYWRPPYPWVLNVTSDACGRACNNYRCRIPFYNAKCINEIKVEDVWLSFKKIFT